MWVGHWYLRTWSPLFWTCSPKRKFWMSWNRESKQRAFWFLWHVPSWLIAPIFGLWLRKPLCLDTSGIVNAHCHWRLWPIDWNVSAGAGCTAFALTGQRAMMVRLLPMLTWCSSTSTMDPICLSVASGESWMRTSLGGEAKSQTWSRRVLGEC